MDNLCATNKNLKGMADVFQERLQALVKEYISVDTTDLRREAIMQEQKWLCDNLTILSNSTKSIDSFINANRYLFV